VKLAAANLVPAFRALPYQRFGRCCRCRRVDDDTGKALWIAGRVNGALVCLECFTARGCAPGRRLAA
jgi:hypothetical protein